MPLNSSLGSDHDTSSVFPSLPSVQKYVQVRFVSINVVIVHSCYGNFVGGGRYIFGQTCNMVVKAVLSLIYGNIMAGELKSWFGLKVEIPMQTEAWCTYLFLS